MKLIVFDVSGTLQGDSPFSPMFDGLKNVIVQLKKQNVQVALATNLSRSGVNAFIQSNQLEPYIDESMTVTEASAKPNPEMLEESMLRTGCIAENTLMIGDTLGDVYMAHLIKVAACAVSWNGYWHDDILNEKPEYKVENVNELCHILSAFTGKNITI